MKRLLKRKLRKGVCIGLGCYTLVLLFLVWPAGQKNLAKQLEDLDLSTSHQHGENASKQKIQDTGSVSGESSLLHQPPWKIPVRRKLSKPDAQQVNVIVEDALPGTFVKKSSWAETAMDFEDLREVVHKDPHPLRDRLRVSDPRSLDRILAGSPVQALTQTGKRTHNNGADPSNKTVEEEEKEDSAAHGEDDPEEHPRQLENWVAPDGAVDSQAETEKDTLPAKNNKTNHRPQQDTHGLSAKSASPKSATTQNPIYSQVVPPVNRHAENFVEISDMVVYSAFYDTRLRRAPLVRMLAMGPVSRRPPVGYLWCVFGLASAEPALVSVRQTGDCGRMRKYCFYMLHCRIPERLLKTNSSIKSIMIVSSDTHDQPFSSRGLGERIHLTIITNNNNGDFYRAPPPKPLSGARSDNTNMTIHNVKSTAWSTTATQSPSPSFSVCVPPIFGKITVLQIVEFIELNRLLGASNVVFYTFRVSRDVSRVLAFYEEAGVISVMPWNIPAPNDVWNKGESIAMGDCLYRNMYIFDYVLFSNMNEFFVPKRETSWQTFLETANSASKKTKTAAYEIVPVKMYPNVTVASFSSKRMTKSESSKFLTLRNTLRGQPLGVNSTRLVVKPERVLEIKSEFLAKPISEDFVSQKVDVHVATVYQFTQKLCSSLNSEVGSMSQNCNELIEDHTFWRYKGGLLERSKNALRTLNRQVDSKLT